MPIPNPQVRYVLILKLKEVIRISAAGSLGANISALVVSSNLGARGRLSFGKDCMLLSVGLIGALLISWGTTRRFGSGKMFGRGVSR